VQQTGCASVATTSPSCTSAASIQLRSLLPAPQGPTSTCTSARVPRPRHRLPARPTLTCSVLFKACSLLRTPSGMKSSRALSTGFASSLWRTWMPTRATILSECNEPSMSSTTISAPRTCTWQATRHFGGDISQLRRPDRVAVRGMGYGPARTAAAARVAKDCDTLSIRAPSRRQAQPGIPTERYSGQHSHPYSTRRSRPPLLRRWYVLRRYQGLLRTHRSDAYMAHRPAGSPDQLHQQTV